MRTPLSFVQPGTASWHAETEPLPDQLPSQNLVRLGPYRGQVVYATGRFVMDPKANSERGLLRKLFDSWRYGIERDGSRTLDQHDISLCHHLDGRYEAAIRAINAHEEGAPNVSLPELYRLTDERSRASKAWERAYRCAYSPTDALANACARMETDAKGAWHDVSLTLNEPAVNALLRRDLPALRSIVCHCRDIAGLWELMNGPQVSDAMRAQVMSDRCCLDALVRLTSSRLLQHLDQPTDPAYLAALQFLTRMPATDRAVTLTRAATKACEVREVGRLLELSSTHRINPALLLANGACAEHVRGLLLHEMRAATDFQAAWGTLSHLLVSRDHLTGGKRLPDSRTPRGYWSDAFAVLFDKLGHYAEVRIAAGELDHRAYIGNLGAALQKNPALRQRLARTIETDVTQFMQQLSTEKSPACDAPVGDFARGMFTFLTGQEYGGRDWGNMRTLHRAELCQPAASMLWSNPSIASHLSQLGRMFSGDRFTYIAPLMKCHPDTNFVRVLEATNPAYIAPERFAMPATC